MSYKLIIVMNILMSFLLSICLLACNTVSKKPAPEVKLVPISPQDSITPTKKYFDFAYNLESPVQSFSLAKSLEEISGLSLTLDSNLLCAVQDENGFLFYINKNTGKIDKKIRFHKDGDYEGIEMVDKDIYVAKSTGTLYRISQLETDSLKVTKYKSFLSKKYEVEGLCYHHQKNSLLLACKSKAGEGDFFKLKRAIYRFDLKTKKLDPKPAFIISLEKIQDFLKSSNSVKDLHRFAGYFDLNLKKLAFRPSAIAIHPLSGNFYVLSSVNKTLIILSPKGEIIHMVKLNKKVHRQPEGMTFEADGTLYISNEGKDGVAKLHRFSYQKATK